MRVLNEIVEPADVALVTAFFLEHVGISQCPLRRSAGLIRAHAGFHAFQSQLLQVKQEFLVELNQLTGAELSARLRRGRGAVVASDERGEPQAGPLRELSLRRTAQRVDAQMRGYMQEHGIRETWPAGERLLVCIGPNPAGARLRYAVLLRRVHEHADRLDLPVTVTPHTFRRSCTTELIRGGPIQGVSPLVVNFSARGIRAPRPVFPCAVDSRASGRTVPPWSAVFVRWQPSRQFPWVRSRGPLDTCRMP